MQAVVLPFLSCQNIFYILCQNKCKFFATIDKLNRMGCLKRFFNISRFFCKSAIQLDKKNTHIMP